MVAAATATLTVGRHLMRSHWPQGLRIHSKNDRLLDLPDSHPAKLTIIAHAECCRDCVGKEIEWTGRKAESFDQSWHSELIGRKYSFSSYAYTVLSFSLILEEWISHPSHVTEGEHRTLIAIPQLELLLDECELAAREDANTRVLNRLPQIRRFNNLWLQSVKRRLEEDGLEIPPPGESNTLTEILGFSIPNR